MEPASTATYNATTHKVNPGVEYCPTWAGGSGPPKTSHLHNHLGDPSNDDVAADSSRVGEHIAKPAPPPPPPPAVRLDTQWIMLNYTLGADGTSLAVDLTPLNGSAPTAVKYAWGIIDCTDYSDPNL